MRTYFETSKAVRGTKRVCPACEVRFYDLAREVIVCPSCGALYTPPSPPVAEPDAGTPPITGKSRWRGRSVWRPGPVSGTDSLPSTSPEVAASAEQGEETESAPEVDTEDEVVVDQDSDDADVSGLFDHDAEEPKEQ
jgi:hypothetical protein